MNALEVGDLRVRFGEVPAVRGVGFAVAPGEVLGLVGESGSGKSVTGLAVMGLLPARATVTGSVRLRGAELLGGTDRELSRVRGRDLAMIFQDPQSALTPVHRIGDQIAEAVRAHGGTTRSRAWRRALDLLDLVGVPDAARAARAYPHQLSGGMRQRVMIAMAVAHDPAVIIADEPTTALDVTVQAQVLEVLRTARQATGAAILMITHDLGVIAGLADRVLVMYAGRVVESGTAEEVFYRPRMPYTIGLLAATPLLDGGPPVPIPGGPPPSGALPPGCPFEPRCRYASAPCRTTEPSLTERAACHNPQRPQPRPAEGPVVRRTRSADVVLQVTGLRRAYGAVQAVDGVDFEVRAGETLALVGESGCGKTTTLMEILALAAPQAGRIVVLGRDVSALPRQARRELRRDLQIVFQDPAAALDPRMRIADLLAEPLRAHGVAEPEVARRVCELLGLVGLDPDFVSRFPRGLSGGQRQRIGIARALALRPRLIVLDEPVSALDVSVQAGIMDLLATLQLNLGVAYLIVAHDLAVVRHLADRVAVMYLGRIAEIGSVEAVYGTPAHPYTRALLSAIPVPDPRLERGRNRVLLPGDPPGPARAPAGCRFRARCPLHTELGAADRERCAAEEPRLRPAGADQSVACHYFEGLIR
ncbi:MAG TPA: ABC transporter ATP-binding protein [Streptosporangiaceae bacterium]|nr:ABC transporter ATP-binding protein [Streptosporangiaceae bacterium]